MTNVLVGTPQIRAEVAPPALAARAESSGRILAVDGLRALACLMVFTFHAWQFSGSPLLALPGLRPGPTGTIGIGSVIATFPSGVDFFMVLSGFCLFWPAARKAAAGEMAKWSTREYVRRRVLRIVPPYYASILVMTVLPNLLVLGYLAAHQPAKWQPLPGAWDYATHLLFIHTWFPETWKGIQGVYWSLGLEVQFYVMFPLVMMGFRRWGIRVTWAMIVLSIAYRWIVSKTMVDADPTVQFLLSITFLGKWMEFAAGMIAAWMVAKRLRRGLMPGTPGTAVVVLALAAYIAGVTLPEVIPVFLPLREIFYSISFGAMLVGLCASRTFVRRAFEWKPVAALGYISFSVFLLHQNIVFYMSQGLEKVAHVTGAMELAMLMTAGLGLIVGVSYVFFLAVEKPFMEKAKSAAKVRRGGVVPVGAGV